MEDEEQGLVLCHDRGPTVVGGLGGLHVYSGDGGVQAQGWY